MLKFIAKKKSNGEVLGTSFFESMVEGDSWVAQASAAGKFGQNDLSLKASQLEAAGLTAEQATSTTQEPVLAMQSVPTLDENGQPALQQNGTPITHFELLPVLDGEGNPTTEIIYHFAKVWEIEVIDEGRVKSRTEARGFCGLIIDEIAAINEDLNDPQLMATIFSTPTFQSIIMALLTGATKTARALMALHGPTLYPQATVDSLVAKMDAFIASES